MADSEVYFLQGLRREIEIEENQNQMPLESMNFSMFNNSKIEPTAKVSPRAAQGGTQGTQPMFSKPENFLKKERSSRFLQRLVGRQESLESIDHITKIEDNSH